MGKKQKKPGQGREKTERKTAKAAQKRARRDDKKFSEEDDIDAILTKIKKEDAKKVAIVVEEHVPAPSPRCNCSVTVNPLNPSELIFFGGEYYNGDKTFVYGDLYRYNTEKNDWKLVSSPNSPPPRSAHQAISWKNSLFVFGGEFTSPNQEKFHHYRDIWKFDLSTNAWEQLQLKGGPSPRSGHRMILCKHKLLVFGGFYDTMREVRYYNDLHVLDLDDYKWQEVKPKPGALWPSPRSAFQFAVNLDEVFMYGGYFKDSAAEIEGSEKGTVLSDMWVLDPRSWVWDKVKKSGMPPSTRAGFSMCVHKKRAILFGGVVDRDNKDILQSTFLNEVYAFQLDTRRWYPMELRKPKVPKPRVKSLKVDNVSEEQLTRGSDVSEAAEEMDVADEDPGLESNNDAGQLSKQLEGANLQHKDCHSAVARQSSSYDADEVVKPCGRINAALAVGRDTLFLYGGTLEIGDREVTLDDLYMLDLNKLDAWNCIIPATKSDWVEPSDEDEDEEEEGEEDEEDDDEEEDEDGDDNDDDEEEMDVCEGDAEETDTASIRISTDAAVAVLKGKGKKMTRKQRKAKIYTIRAQLGLADAERTPQTSETLRQFFARTSMYWQMAAYEHTQHTGKELRKDGFDLAEARYRELRPILDELERLEIEQRADEAEDGKAPARSSKSKDKNKRPASKR